MQRHPLGMVRESHGEEPPLFSIGITTYNRPEMLRECLRSILAQTFTRFEVIVGNDYVARRVSLAELGVQDSRIRVVNHAENLGERGNLNALLAQSRGVYFTWQADDDFYDRKYLESLASALASAPADCAAAFTSYRVIRGSAGPEAVCAVASLPVPRVLTGSEFLRGYWDGSVRTMGLVGMYRREYLVAQGGVAHLAPGPIAVMSEYELLVRCGLLPHVAYTSAPLVIYRAHAASWSTTTQTAVAARAAGLSLLRRNLPLFSHAELVNDLDAHASGLVNVVLRDVLKIVARERRGPGIWRDAIQYIQQLRAATRELLSQQPGTMAHVTRGIWTQFAMLLPQLVFIRRAPPAMRTGAVRLRGLFTGEIVVRSPSPTL